MNFSYCYNFDLMQTKLVISFQEYPAFNTLDVVGYTGHNVVGHQNWNNVRSLMWILLYLGVIVTNSLVRHREKHLASRQTT